MKQRYAFTILLLMAFILPACSSREGAQWSADKKHPKSYKMATRQLPPQPVYSGLRWVRPPEMDPSRKIEASNAGIITPVISFNVKDVTLKEASLVLAASSMYSSYCSSKVEDKKITITTIGTLDEVAAAISQAANIDVVVDHPGKAIRFLSNSSSTEVY